MEILPEMIFANIVALLLIGIFSTLAGRIQRLRPRLSNESTLIRDTYIGKFFDFFLTYTRRLFLCVITFAILLNLLGSIVLHKSHGLLFLDTVGTAVAAFILGPWWGATAGLLTNMIGTVVSGPSSEYHLFAIVNCSVGIAWGFIGILQRRYVAEIDTTSPWSFSKSIIFLGAAGVAVSSLSACYILYYGIGVVNVHAANVFHYTLYFHLQRVFFLAHVSDFWIFFLSELVFNIPDKFLSIILAIAILHLIFPIVKTLNKMPTTINFIKLSTGSHLCFCILYLIYYLTMAPKQLHEWFNLYPLLLCIASYAAIIFFIPKSLFYYNILAEYFSRNRIPKKIIRRRKRFLLLAMMTVFVVSFYFTAVAFFGKEYGVWKNLPAHVLLGEKLGVLIISLLFLLLALPSLYFLFNDTRAADKAIKSLIEKKRAKES